jgi:hypothetical protein
MTDAEIWAPWLNDYPCPFSHDFRNFLARAWEVLGLPSPTPIQYDIAHYLQHGPDRLIIEGYRGVGKSWITGAFTDFALDQTYLCTKHGHKPQWETNFLLLSAAETKAKEFSTFCRALIRDMPELHYLLPGDDDPKSVLGWSVAPAAPSQTPSVRVGGIYSQIVGSRADCIIPDDVEVPNNSDSQLKREKLLYYVQEVERILKPGGVVRYLGTPQSEETIYNVLPKRGYHKRIWPVRFPTLDQEKAYGENLSPAIQAALVDDDKLRGEPSDPDRFDEFEIQKREVGQGRSGFALQYMLDPRISDEMRYPLKLSDFLVLDCDRDTAPERLIYGGGPDNHLKDLPNVGFSGDRWNAPMAVVGDWIPYTGTVMAVDPSGRGGDELAYAVVGMLNGYLHVLDVGGFYGIGYSDAVLRKLSNLSKQWKCNYVVIEQNFGDGMFMELWKPIMREIYPVTVEEVRHHVQKEKRIIDTLEPVMNQHKMVVNRQLILDDYCVDLEGLPEEEKARHRLFHQITRITKERGSLALDDRVDALAMAVKYWIEVMAVDDQEAMVARREELLMEDLERHAQHCLGYSPPKGTMLTADWDL